MRLGLWTTIYITFRRAHLPRNTALLGYSHLPWRSVFLGSFIPKNMIIPIDDSPNAIQESLNQCTQALKDGHAIVFFPEGRSMGNGHGQYRTGAAYVAAKAQCPIVPVRIQRTVFFRHRVVFGKAHAPPQSKDRATLSRHTQMLKEHILNL